MQYKDWSARALLTYKRTYSRPKSNGAFEEWDETIDRVISYQRFLWENAKGKALSNAENEELRQLRQLMFDRCIFLAGRTLWLGGTDVSKSRSSSMFNCSHTRIETSFDVVDALWLMLQGCGTGLTLVTGGLSGFTKPLQSIEIIRSTRTEKGGTEENQESWNQETKTWTIKVGDSAVAWAKSVGKLLARKHPADHLVLDFSEIRPAGERLKGYGWISQGDTQIAKAYGAIANVLSRRAGQLLTKIDCLDICNHLGTILSSRRSAQIALCDYGSEDWEAFARAKKDYWSTGNSQRAQSNNSLMFNSKPSSKTIEDVLTLMQDSGGSEPGFFNAEQMRLRAPYATGTNPCSELLLSNKGLCNLCEIDVARFKDNWRGLLEATRLIARANYRQTCVDLRDEVLQLSWHENNQFLHLCGVSLSGIIRRPDLLNPYALKCLRNAAITGAYSMAHQLDLPEPKNVTTGKPSGTVSKVGDTTEGVHKPLGKYIFNNISFSVHDPLVATLVAAGYRTFDHPLDPSSILVTFPVAWEGIEFDKKAGLEVNLESAIVQLDRYKLLMDNFCDNNQSVTISYSKEELPDIKNWLDRNWDSYVGVSFLPRTDPTAKAEDLGYPYLPQQPVTKEDYNKYVTHLKPIEIEAASDEKLEETEVCTTGACPIR